MLKNSGFEGTGKGEWTRNTHNGTEYGEIYVPKHWVAWWEEGSYRRPEMKVIPKVEPFLDPARIYTGNYALQSFTTYGRQHAGLYQVVQGLTPGTRYRFTVMAHAWSAHRGDLAVGPYCSAGVGCGAVYLTEVPPLNGDQLNDAKGNFAFSVGVGLGTPDPFSSAVQWGQAAYIYNVYHEVPPIEFVAPTDGIVTVYLRALSLWGFRTSDTYWDAAELTVVSGDEPEPPPEPEPTEEGRGQPREQYQRTYVLLSPEATSALAQAAITDGAWNEVRFTIGQSADDAGVGNLDDRRVVAINPSEWGDGEDGGGLLGFFEQYYPGVAYIHMEATAEDVGQKLKAVWNFPFEPGWEQYLLWQCNPLWGSKRFGATSCTLTICQAGCFLDSLAMTQRIYKIDENATPLTANAALGPEGYSGCMLLWSASKAKLGISIRSGNTEEAEAHMANGGVCMIRVAPKDPMHFVLAVEALGDGDYTILDPYKNYCGPLSDHYGVHSWRILKPVDAPLPPIDLPHIYAVHEDCSHEAACLMRNNNIKGYIVWTEGIGFNPSDYSGRDYRIDAGNFGHTSIVRLNNGYGGSGTIPMEEYYDKFAQRAANHVAASHGCNIWIIGNEQNNEREQPMGQVVMPEMYAQCFNKCRAAIKAVQPDAVVMPGAIDGYNAQLMDSREYMRRMWLAIDGADGVCVHAYTHGPDPALITSDIEFSHAPLLGVNYNFKNFVDMLRQLPSWAQALPVYITETNTWAQTDDPNPPEDKLGWLDVNNGWIQSAYGFVNGWNSARGKQQIRCLTVYRWPPIDRWVIHGKGNVIADFTAALQRQYKPYL